jgi:thiol-disulfide isomerase/thioredoxin
MNSSGVDDWRISLLGEYIRRNPESNDDNVETPLDMTPTREALSDSKYDYIALYISADYCTSCKQFAPVILASEENLKAKKCKVIYVSSDRDEAAFAASLRSLAGIDTMPYDASKTQLLRDVLSVKTIPSLLILRNENFATGIPVVVADARYSLPVDPQCRNFPWHPNGNSSSFSPMDRLIIRGEYGKWWDYGHKVNPAKPEEPYMDEHAVRARAGILNIITWIAIMNVFFWPEELYFAKYLFPFVFWEFLFSMKFGLTPLAPIGVLGTLLAILLQPKPSWTPARPKRFAWLIGLTLSSACFSFFLLREQLGKAYLPLQATVVFTCNLATWLESAMGFCVGCFMFNYMLVPLMGWDPCVECI